MPLSKEETRIPPVHTVVGWLTFAFMALSLEFMVAALAGFKL
jgi:hypothetical protein